MRFLVTAILALAVFPAAAVAAPPVAETGGVADVEQSTATLKGTVNPKGAPTVFYFKYGLTKEYGAQTPDADAGTADKRAAVTTAIGNLPPFTKIHYRLFARTGDTTVSGADRVFQTKRQPLGLTLTAAPAFIKPGQTTTLSGTLAGTGNAGRQVVLQSNPFPYSQGFMNVGNPQVVGETGGFSFPVLNSTTNTTYRVQIPGKPEIVSPELLVGVKVALTTKVKKARKHLYRFTGALAPASPGAVLEVQRRVGSSWKTSKTFLAGVKSKFDVKVTIRKRGTFRVQATKVADQYVPNVGRSIRIRPNR